jgi:hypothetical protein
MDFNQNSIKKVFEIKSSNELKYVPFKIVQKSISPTMNSLVTQRVVVFVGDVDANTKALLLKMEKNQVPSIQDSNKLKDIFGPNWKHLLHLGKNQHGGDKGTDEINFDEDSEPEEEQELDFDLDKELETTQTETTPVKDEKELLSGVKYIYDYINIDDEIDTIKRKIEGYMNIEYSAQHNWYINQTDKKIHILDYQCRIIVNETISQPFMVSINDLFSNTDESKKKILGLVVDQDFIRRYKLKSQMFIMNTTNNILFDQMGNNTTMYTMDFVSILNLIGYGKIQSLRANNYNQFESFYYGFVLKYWPVLKINDLVSIINRSPSTASLTSKHELKIFSDRQYYINLINSIDRDDIDNVLTMNSGITGFNFSINKKFANLFETDILKLIDIYNELDVTDEIPFISYYIHGMQKPKYKIHIKDESEFYINQQTLKWTDSFNTGITFKIRMVLDKKSPLYDSSFMTVDLNAKGKFNVLTTWKEGYSHSVFDHINLNSFYAVVNNLIVTINKKSPKSSFIKNIKIPEIDTNKKNVSFQFINFFSRLKFKDPRVSLNYKILRILVNTFRAHVREDRPKKMRRSQTQNEAKIGYIRKSQYRKYPKSKQLNQFWIEPGKLKSVESKSIYTHISEAIQNEPKIAISGIKNFEEFRFVFNFIIRLIYLSVDLQNFFQRPGAERLKEEYKKNTIREKDLNKEEYVETYYASKKKEISEGMKKSSINQDGQVNTKYKKIKLLKAYDRNLFGYKKTDKYESYSRLCQNEKQPIPMTNDELKKYKMNKNHSNTLSIKYDSADDTINYACTHTLYKYPGFISPDKHPENRCLPCCFINDSTTNPKSKNAKTYNMCLGSNKDESDKYEEKGVVSQKYIKQYTKFIVDNRLSNPPPQLNRFLNDTKIGSNGKIEFKGERRSRRSIYETEKKHPPTYLVLGIPQHNRSFITSVESLLDIPRGQLINKLIEALRSNQSIFGTLSGGKIKRQYGNIENFIDYLQNPNSLIEPNDIDDLIIRLNSKYADNLRIILLYEYDDGMKVKCNDSTSISTAENSIIVFNTEKYYYPIILIGNDPNSNNIEKVFTKKHKIVVLIDDLLKKMCSSESLSVAKMKYVNINLNLIDLQNILKKIGYFDKIKYQLVNHKNYVIGIVISDNGSNFTLPVLMSDPIKGIPLTTNYYNGSWNTVYPFLLKISKEIFSTNKYKSHPQSNNTIISKLIVDASQRFVVGVVLRYKFEMYIDKIPVSKIKIDPIIKKLRYKVQAFNPDIVNKSIKDNIIIPDKRVTETSDIKYQLEIYDLVKFEINNILFQERNMPIRNKIIKLFEKYPNKTMIDHLTELNENIEQVDIYRLTELLRVVSYFGKQEKGQSQNKVQTFTDYFNKYTFFFDLMTITKIDKILGEKHFKTKESNVKLIEDIIKKLLMDTVKIGKPKNKKITGPCSDETKEQHCKSGYCVWDKSGKCKVLIETETEYKNILSRVVNEIIKNISARNEFLKVKMSWQK